MALVLGDIVRRHAAVAPDKVAYVVPAYNGVRRTAVTYGELHEQSDRLAGWLWARGVGHGGRVGALMRNNAAYPIVYFAVAKVGAVAVPMSFRYRAIELKELVTTFRPTLVLGEEELLAELPASVAGIAVDELDLDAVGPPPVAVDENDPHVIFSTSGTTGGPKGVLQSHRAYCLQAIQPVMSDRGTGEGDIGLCMFPMFHMSGWATSLIFLAARATVVIGRQPDPAALLAAIQAEGVTQFYGLPETLRAMCTLPSFDSYDLSSLRDLNSGTSAMSADDVELIVERFAVDGIRIHYGSSEAGPVATLPAPESRRRSTSIGKAPPGVETRVLAPSGAPVAPGEVGEIVVRSEFLMLGYDGRPDETAAVVRDGWYHTQDLATVDEDGFIYYRGRLKESIRSGGETIVPEELERCIAGLAGVRECAVVGLPDATWGEAAVAVVVADEGVGADDVIAHCQMSLASFKAPRRVVFVDALPRTEATAKVAKAELRAMLLA